MFAGDGAVLAGLGVPRRSCWALAHLAKYGKIKGTDLAAEAGVTVEYGRPYVDRLVERGFVVRDDGVPILTPAGGAAADRVFAARRDGLERLPGGWPAEQHADLADMPGRLSGALVGEDADRRILARRP